MTAARAAAGEGSAPSPATVAVAGLDAGLRHERDADAVAVRLAQLLPASWHDRVVVATHVEREPPAHVVLAIQVPPDADDAWPALTAAIAAAGLDGPALVLGERATGAAGHVRHARAAVAAHVGGLSGRGVVIPGLADLPDRLLVRDLLGRAPVDRVEVLAGGPAAPGVVLATRGFVRPRWSQGSLVLHVQPGAGGVLVPFEVPDPTPCCADHA